MEPMLVDAQMIALRHHQYREYRYDLSWCDHLQNVVDTLKRHDANDQLIVATWLHNILRYTNMKYSEVAEEFTPEIAEIVYCAADELGRDRQESKTKTFLKACDNLQAARLLLAIRLTNVEYAISNHDTDRLSRYQKEQATFSEVFTQCLHDTIYQDMHDELLIRLR